ncbi:hypothetical protein EON65_49030 [archaeon]|nr:MAG: hypothetical protein EON65_49030 [archaeon]
MLRSFSSHLSGNKTVSGSQTLLPSFFLSYEKGDRAARIKSERLKQAVEGITKKRKESARGDGDEDGTEGTVRGGGIDDHATEVVDKKKKRKM